MNKQEVIDYVMSTPHNVNRTILSQSLDEIGTQADWNQNDSTKADYVKNRTHYTEVKETTYEVDLAKDGVATGEGVVAEVEAEVAQVFYDNWESVTFTRPNGSVIAVADFEIIEPATGLKYVGEEGFILGVATNEGEIALVANEPGIFKLTIREELVHKIPEKYLPDGIGGGSGSGGYSVIVRCDKNYENPELLFGSYDDIVAKAKAGELVNALVYVADTPYNIYVHQVPHILADWDESYYVRLDFVAMDSTEKHFFIRSDNTVS